MTFSTKNKLTASAIAGVILGACVLPAQASYISDNNLQATPYILGGNGDGATAPADVIAGRTDDNVSSSRFTGVVSLNPVINGEGFICTGTAISPRHILTAGHCVDEDGLGNVMALDGVDNYLDVIFNHDGDAAAVIGASSIKMHKDYEGFNICPDGTIGCVNDDVAIIELDSDIPAGVEIYDFYGSTVGGTEIRSLAAGSDVDGDTFTLVGYGTRGDGFWGEYSNFDDPFFEDAAGDNLGFPSFTEKLVGGNIVDWIDPNDEGGKAQEVWYADFDGRDDFFGTDIDPLCNDFGTCSSWLDESIEANIGGGDSGGPSFFYDSLNDQYLLAGINTFGLNYQGWAPGAFGDILGGVLLESYTPWIQRVVRNSQVPEPGTLMLLGAGLLGLLRLRRK